MGQAAERQSGAAGCCGWLPKPQPAPHGLRSGGRFWGGCCLFACFFDLKSDLVVGIGGFGLVERTRSRFGSCCAVMVTNWWLFCRSELALASCSVSLLCAAAGRVTRGNTRKSLSCRPPLNRTVQKGFGFPVWCSGLRTCPSCAQICSSCVALEAPAASACLGCVFLCRSVGSRRVGRVVTH